MAKVASSEGELQVSKCHCETGRKRHRIPRSIHIPFETTQIFNIPNQHHDSEDEADEDEDDDSTVSGGANQDNQLVMLEDDDDDEHPIPEVNMLDDGPLIIDLLTAGGTLPAVVFNNAINDEFEMDIGDESADPDSDGPLEEDGPPQVATWRMNLTALSQVYNLYMVAYADKIYISRPRSCVSNALPAEPDLILRPPASTMSLSVVGYLDPNFPHQVNHLVVGEFGNEEILLLAYDDGDVIGYYTRHIENELRRRERDGRNNKTTPEPFFHENVGKSAWGLAIHKQSRIIAVSSNTHNICVFVFALTGQPYRHTPGADPVEFFRNIIIDENGNVVDPGKDPSYPPVKLNPTTSDGSKIAALENAIRRRDANWRIILETGRSGTNIPNIAFSNDVYGEAVGVVAVDINGRLWLMDFWHFDNLSHVIIEGLHRGRSRNRFQGQAQPHKPRGWGVLVLPESSFLPVKDKEDALGLSLNEAKYASSERIGRWIDISQGIKHVKNNSGIHPWVRSGNTQRFAFNPMEPRRAQLESPWYDFDANATLHLLHDSIGDNPRAGRERGLRLGRPKSGDPGQQTVLEDGSSILRTYEMDVELRSFEEGGVGIMFEKVIDQSRPSHAVLPSMRMSHERLANLIHVPELSLVVAGSMCGRVALITLTRPEERGLPFKRAFKVEAILPTKRDEDNQLRPICPLLGVAVGPTPFSGNVELTAKPVSPKRYRIMLHYYDLRILSYEIFRRSRTDPLSIV
ncbi:hypothetical protein F4776DRAFT_246630 [Hypoxylon sp. NC0597]|nr:hypothetical protein F4776DRAFT_246630 [Hypoxylon sp. NC0597]